MTWLFAQVWLWSLAAFLAGSVATWLLFVLPLRRRMRILHQELADRDRALEPEWVPDVGEAPTDHGERDPTAWDILPVESHPEPVETEPVEREPEPSSDRPFRTGDLAGYWSLRPGAPSAPDVDIAPDVPVADRGPALMGESKPGAQEPAEFAAPLQDDASDPPDTERRDVAPPEFPSGSAAADRDRQYADRARTVRLTSQPVVSPEAAAQDGTSSDDSDPVANTWFREDEWGDTDTDTGTDGDGRPSLSGQLRSLFEPLESRGADPGGHPGIVETPDTAGRSGLDTQGLDTQGGAAPGRDGDDEPQPLPRRVPGATSRPGTPPLNRADGDPAASRQAQPGSQPTPEGSQRSLGEPQQDPVAEWPSRDDAGVAPGRAPEEWYPDEVNPAAERPGAGYTVKGHFASRQYHTPESPHFDRVAAEVWFHSGAEAEQAGFEPWDGRRRS